MRGGKKRERSKQKKLQADLRQKFGWQYELLANHSSQRSKRSSKIDPNLLNLSQQPFDDQRLDRPTVKSKKRVHQKRRSGSSFNKPASALHFFAPFPNRKRSVTKSKREAHRAS